MEKIYSVVIDAITASGLEFKSVKKETIFSFLQSQNVPSGKWQSIYNGICEYYNGRGKNQEKVDNRNIKTVVDYTDMSHNDVKVRNPRKSVFTEIKKIAG